MSHNCSNSTAQILPTGTVTEQVVFHSCVHLFRTPLHHAAEISRVQHSSSKNLTTFSAYLNGKGSALSELFKHCIVHSSPVYPAVSSHWLTVTVGQHPLNSACYFFHLNTCWSLFPRVCQPGTATSQCWMSVDHFQRAAKDTDPSSQVDDNVAIIQSLVVLCFYIIHGLTARTTYL